MSQEQIKDNVAKPHIGSCFCAVQTKSHKKARALLQWIAMHKAFKANMSCITGKLMCHTSRNGGDIKKYLISNTTAYDRMETQLRVKNSTYTMQMTAAEMQRKMIR